MNFPSAVWKLYLVQFDLSAVVELIYEETLGGLIHCFLFPWQLLIKFFGGATDWSHEATLLLIETYRNHQEGFSDHTKKKHQIWNEISKVLQEQGYQVDGTACDQKMRTLKRRYV